jgi:hypothetical protein
VSTIMSTVNIKPEVRQERTVCCSMIRSRSHLATVCVCVCVFFSSLVCSVCDCDCLQLQADLLQVYLEMLRVQQNTTSILRLADHLQQVSVAPCCRTLLPVVFIPHTSRKRPASASVRSWSLLVAGRSPTYLPSGSLDLWVSWSFGRLVVRSLARSLTPPPAQEDAKQRMAQLAAAPLAQVLAQRATAAFVQQFALAGFGDVCRGLPRYDALATENSNELASLSILSPAQFYARLSLLTPTDVTTQQETVASSSDPNEASPTTTATATTITTTTPASFLSPTDVPSNAYHPPVRKIRFALQ